MDRNCSESEANTTPFSNNITMKRAIINLIIVTLHDILH